MKDLNVNELVKKGLTDEEILAEVKKVLSDRQSELQKAKEIEAAEKNLTKAMAEYFKVVAGIQFSEEELEDLISITKMMTSDIKKMPQKPKRKEKTPDDILAEFLKSL